MNNIDKDEVLAVVAGDKLTNADLDAFLETAPNEHKAYFANPKLRETYLEQLIALRSYAKLGEEMKLDETEDFKKILDSARKDILAQMAMTEIIKDVAVTEEEIQEYYNNHKDDYTEPENVKARHILVSDEEQCKKIIEGINKGEKTFEEYAKECSTCPSGAQGGDLGAFGRGDMVKEFEDAAFDAKVGVTFGPVRTQFGYHVIRVDEKHPAYLLPLVDVKDEIESKMIKEKQAETYSAKLDELMEKYVQK